MQAAVIPAIGQAPELREVERPSRSQGQAVVRVSAVALNPIDVATAAGRFYGGTPETPYVAGSEAVGAVVESDSLPAGTRVYARVSGALGEYAVAGEEACIELPAEPEDALAAACGIAGVAGWLAATWRADVGEADRVLVLGATGTVGAVALQAARLRGAERIVAAGRSQEGLRRALELGAAETVVLDDADGLADRLRQACGGDGPTVVIDPLWGPPLMAALEAAAPSARIAHVGQSAGGEATLASALVRGKQLSILGYSNFRLSAEQYRDAYLELLDHAASGRVAIDVDTFPLERVAEAWERQARGGTAKVVVSVRAAD